MRAHAIQHPKAIAPETFVQQGAQSNAVVHSDAHHEKRVVTIDVRPDYVLDNHEENQLVTTARLGEAHPKSSNHEVARIAIKAKGRVLFVDPLDVAVAKAQGNYVALVHKSGSYLVRETMATAEQKLTPLGFVRIHRSILVNTTLVRDLRRDNTGTYVLRTTDGTEYPVGRVYKDNLKAIAMSWLGVELI
jgi:DNA-binding LytR/AlgR family response regulator